MLTIGQAVKQFEDYGLITTVKNGVITIKREEQ